MDDDRKLLRSVVRTVHPDLFTKYPSERQRNSESLKLLNRYLDDVANSVRPEPVSLDFWAKTNGELHQVTVDLVENGSLAPLFFAFNLMSEEEFLASRQSSSQTNQDLLDWLKATVEHALETADQHYALKTKISAVRAQMEEKYQLAEIQFGQEIGVSQQEQKRQLESLSVFGQGLEDVCEDCNKFSGLNFCLHHPESCPLDFVTFRASSTSINAGMQVNRISSDGCIHVMADVSVIREALLSVEVDRARLLSKLKMYWVRRARDLTYSLKDLLRVEDVLCDTSASENAQKFVLWAGCILGHRSAVDNLLLKRTLSFSLLVHSDDQAPMIDHMAASSILQVRSDCPPRTVLDFLGSDACRSASQEAKEIKDTSGEEEAILESVRSALGAKQVIRVCSVNMREQVLEAAKKLIDNADSICQYIDLSNVNLAIDDCYQMWESGFISIPYDFQLKDLRPQLQKMLVTSVNDTVNANVTEAFGEHPRDVSSSCIGRGRQALQISYHKKVGRIWRRPQYVTRRVRPTSFVILRGRSLSLLK